MNFEENIKEAMENGLLQDELKLIDSLGLPAPVNIEPEENKQVCIRKNQSGTGGM